METIKRRGRPADSGNYQEKINIRFEEGQINILSVLTSNISHFVRVAVANEIKRITSKEKV